MPQALGGQNTGRICGRGQAVEGRDVRGETAREAERSAAAICGSRSHVSVLPVAGFQPDVPTLEILCLDDIPLV